VRFLLSKMCRQLGVPTKQFTPDANRLLAAYDWPGNVRELENVIERAVNTCAGSDIPVEYLPRTLLEKSDSGLSDEVSLRDMERRLIVETIRKTGGHISKAAALLGIRRNTLYSKLKKYAIPHSREALSSDRPGTVR
jgi:DNA-binding NtrC family response regulator